MSSHKHTVWKLSLYTKSGPPGEWWRFLLTPLAGGRSRTLRISTDIELWLETIVADAYQKVGGLGVATVVPSREVITLFSEVKLQ